MTHQLYNDNELLKQFAQGDETAFRQLFDIYKEKLYSFVLHLTHSKADAEEIVQEVFLKLWEMKGALSEVQEAGKYIYTIARNKTFNHLAKVARNNEQTHQLWLNISVTDTHIEDILDAEESRQLITKSLAQLTPQKQKIFQLSREEGLSHQQIAEMLGISKSRVNNILVEILRHIKDYLHSHSPLLANLFWLGYGYLLF